MKILILSATIVGKKTRTILDTVYEQVQTNRPDAEVQLLDLADYQLVFSDGRLYTDYSGDTRYVAEQVMSADALIIGTPIFQASIPGTLKNLFDLLPEKALRDKVVSLVVTAGSNKHYLVAEQQLKPILSYMKAMLVPVYLFAHEADFQAGKVVNEDIFFRSERLVQDTLLLLDTYQEMQGRQEELYF